MVAMSEDETENELSKEEIEHMKTLDDKIDQLRSNETDTVKIDRLENELVNSGELDKVVFQEAVENLKNIGKVFEPVDGNLDLI